MDRTKKMIIRLTKKELDSLKESAAEKSLKTGKKCSVSEYVRNCIFEESCHPKELKKEIRKLERLVHEAKVQVDLVGKKAELISERYVSKKMEITWTVEDIKKLEDSLSVMEYAFDLYRERLETLYGDHEADEH